MSTPTRLPVTVIVPTIGRTELLQACLQSIAACRPAPAEILVVDQSGAREVAALVSDHESDGARHLRCEGRGIALAMNSGLRAAAHDIVLRTDDDCTVAADWIDVAWRRMAARPEGIVTGQVLPGGEGAWVPSLITDQEPRDFDGQVTVGMLYTGNMAVDRRRALELGGLDERPGFTVAASDNDFGYRWLRDGRPMRYEPDMKVWHHDWRTPDQLSKRYADYARGQGTFYAKHLFEGDRRMLRWIALDVRRGLRAEVAGRLRRQPRASHEARALIPWLGVGFVRGWIEARKLAAPARG